MNDTQLTERKLVVTTSWGFFGSFGVCLICSGFNAASLPAGLSGFALMVAGFVSHVIINHVFRIGFTEGEVAFGLGAYAVALLIFAVSWVLLPHFGFVEIVIGISGFTALSACFVFYMVASHGVRGSIEMLDEIRKL